MQLGAGGARPRLQHLPDCAGQRRAAVGDQAAQLGRQGRRIGEFVFRQQARLLRLGPGARVHEHRDYDLNGPDADRRLHIPLLSPPNVDFWLDGQRVPMAAGECWFLDLARPHRVDNRDTAARIHLVIDCKPDAWLEQMIVEGLPDTPAPGLADTDLQRFQRLVTEDDSLSLALRTLHDPEMFIARTLELAVERGLVFSREELRTAMRNGRRQWHEQWSC